MANNTYLMDYDPNLTLGGHCAKQLVRLTFAQWKYRGTFDVVVRGNITGLDVIKSAIENFYESLPYTELPFDDGGYATIHLGELTVDDEEDAGEEWLSSMLINAEILSIEPDGSIWDE